MTDQTPIRKRPAAPSPGKGKNWLRAAGPSAAALLVGLLLSLSHSPGAETPPSEYQVKAAFLLNFTRFVEWPSTAFADANSPFAICIVGDDPFGSALDRLVEGETAGGRRMIVQRMRRPPTPGSCQVVFVSQPEKDLPQLLAGAGPGVLTVGEAEGFVREGGIIQFILENRRVRFDINQSAAEKAALRVSARLLNVARAVDK